VEAIQQRPFEKRNIGDLIDLAILKPGELVGD
jgi:hypothetical protein